ncbi:HBL392Wp [Eremothecium sinecaudum]|uniref:HBL392Wp n=1 Tax=Eremothecium sinecaudum TaxID=45286 RepID=A0A120K0N0_9SACH|nr:HBL392Wp [Eremothecium sinecaudum]AMD18510.1 HBL392Wp [Eremothecium sinecaudum]
MVDTNNVNSDISVKDEADVDEFLRTSATKSARLDESEYRKHGSLIKPVLLCLATSFGGFIFGWDIGTIGGITNMPAFQNTFGNRFDPDTGLNRFPDMLLGLIIAVFNIGCAVGGLTLAKVGDKRGRRMGICVALGIYVIGVSIQLLHTHAWFQFFFGRIITGFSVGTSAVLVPMFVSESAPVQIRGAMVVLYQLMITFGILLGNTVNFACKRTIADSLSNNNWQIPIGLGIFWAAIVLAGISFMPESAHFLAAGGRMESARKSFAIMNSMETTDEYVINQVEKMSRPNIPVNVQDEPKGKWEFITGEPKLLLRLFVGIMVMAFQQLTGVNYFFYYGTTLFSSVGIEDSYITAIILSAVNFLSTFIGIYIVERLGRRSCLVLGSVGMFTNMAIYASIGSFALNRDGVLPNRTAGYLMIVFTCLYIICFASTSGPVTFVVISELFPTRTKAISMAICTSVNWLVNFLISLLTPTITRAIGFKYGYVFALFLFVSIFFFYALVPETKGLTIDQVDAIYAGKKIPDESDN